MQKLVTLLLVAGASAWAPAAGGLVRARNGLAASPRPTMQLMGPRGGQKPAKRTVKKAAPKRVAPKKVAPKRVALKAGPPPPPRTRQSPPRPRNMARSKSQGRNVGTGKLSDDEAELAPLVGGAIVTVLGLAALTAAPPPPPPGLDFGQSLGLAAAAFTGAYAYASSDSEEETAASGVFPDSKPEPAAPPPPEPKPKPKPKPPASLANMLKTTNAPVADSKIAPKPEAKAAASSATPAKKEADGEVQSQKELKKDLDLEKSFKAVAAALAAYAIVGTLGGLPLPWIPPPAAKAIHLLFAYADTGLGAALGALGPVGAVIGLVRAHLVAAVGAVASAGFGLSAQAAALLMPTLAFVVAEVLLVSTWLSGLLSTVSGKAFGFLGPEAIDPVLALLTSSAGSAYASAAAAAAALALAANDAALSVLGALGSALVQLKNPAEYLDVARGLVSSLSAYANDALAPVVALLVSTLSSLAASAAAAAAGLLGGLRTFCVDTAGFCTGLPARLGGLPSACLAFTQDVASNVAGLGNGALKLCRLA